MEVKSDYWIDLGDLGEQPIEISADVTRGDADGPSIFRGVWIELEKITLTLNSTVIDITKDVLGSILLKQACEDRISDVYAEAINTAAAHRRRSFRHLHEVV